MNESDREPEVDQPSGEGFEPAEPVGDPPRLLRRRSPGMLGGIANGLGHYLNVEPLFFRIAFVVLTFFVGGSGIVLYAAAWLLLPTEHDPDPRPLAVTPNVPSLVAGFAVLFIGSILVADGWSWAFDAEVFLPLSAVAFGVWLLNQRHTNAGMTRPPPPGHWAPPTTPAHSFGAGDSPPPSTAPVPPAFDAPTSSVPPQSRFTAPPTPPRPWAVAQPNPLPPRPVRSGPPITAVTLASSAVAVGALSVLDSIAGIDISATVMIAVVVTILGIGITASALFDRALFLFPVAFVALSMLAVAPLIDTTWSGGIGTRDVVVSSAEDLDPEYSLGIGELELDLRALTLTEDTTVTVNVGAGYADILVAPDIVIDLRATNRAGYIEAFGIDDEGVGNDLRIIDDPGRNGTDPPRLTIVADVTFGYLEISR